MEKAYFTVKEVAEMLGVTTLTIRNWDKKGKLVACRNPINNYRVYKREDIEALLERIGSPQNKTTKPAKPEKPKVTKLKVRFLD